MSELNEELDNEMQDSDNHLFKFKLPELNEMPKNNSRFLDYVRDSLFQLDSMIDSWNGYIDGIRSGYEQTVSIPDHPFIGRDDAIKTLEVQLEKTHKRNSDFKELALMFTMARQIHKAEQPSNIVHLFVDIGNGNHMYAQVDTVSEEVSYGHGGLPEIGTFVDGELDIDFSKEDKGEPFYFVSCLIDGLDPEKLIGRAAWMTASYMDEQFPKFYEKEDCEVKDFESKGLKLVVDTDEESKTILFLAPLPNKHSIQPSTHPISFSISPPRNRYDLN